MNILVGGPRVFLEVDVVHGRLGRDALERIGDEQFGEQDELAAIAAYLVLLHVLGQRAVLVVLLLEIFGELIVLGHFLYVFPIFFYLKMLNYIYKIT